MLGSLLDSIAIIAKVYAVLMLLCFAGFVCVMATGIGDNAIVDETFLLSPGAAKTFTLPPGMIHISIDTDAPIDKHSESLTGHGEARGMTRGDERIGTIVTTSYTISNSGNALANVSMRISTGVLNPFGYL